MRALRKHSGQFLGLAAVSASLAAVVPAWGQESGVPRIVEPGLLEAVAFYLFGGVAVVSCLGVAIAGNIVRMAVWLFGALSSVAALYFLLAANLLAAIQLIVYAGGTLVLIIFGVMLTSKSPWARFDAKRYELVAAALVCVTLLVGLVWAMQDAFPGGDQLAMRQGVSVAQFGEAMLTTYLLPFEVASVLLLAVMIGAAFLARPEKRGGGGT